MSNNRSIKNLLVSVWLITFGTAGAFGVWGPTSGDRMASLVFAVIALIWVFVLSKDLRAITQELGKAVEIKNAAAVFEDDIAKLKAEILRSAAEWRLAVASRDMVMNMAMITLKSTTEAYVLMSGYLGEKYGLGEDLAVLEALFEDLLTAPIDIWPGRGMDATLIDAEGLEKAWRESWHQYEQALAGGNKVTTKEAA